MIYRGATEKRSSGAVLATTPLADHRFLNFTVAFYVLAIYLVSAVPGLSRTVHVAVGLMLIAHLFNSARNGLTLHRSPVIPLALVFMTYALASVFWSINQGEALISAIGLIVDVAGACLVLLAFQNGAKPLVLAVSAAVGASVQAIVAIQQFMATGAVRAEGLSGNANSLAIQLSISAFLLLLIVPKPRWSQILALALLVIATLTSASRKMIFVWFSYGILLVRTFGVHLRRRSVVAAALLIGLPVIVWLVATYSPLLVGPLEELTFVSRIEGTLEGRETDKRSGLIEDALARWWDRPIVGFGINQYRIISRYSAYSHNNYTELLASLGVVGLMLFYSIYGVLIIKAVRGVMSGREVAWTVLAILLVLLLMDIARVSYTARSTWLLLGVVTYFLHWEPEAPKPAAS